MLLQACVNGARRASEHPRLTATPEAVAAEARDAVSAGAGAIHVHPKSARGDDSLASPDVARFVAAVRAACPRIPVGVTTGAWAAESVDDRLAAIAAWDVLPDFASVNWHEAGADVVAERLLEAKVEIEAGIWHRDGLARWARSPHRDHCLRVLVEVPDLAGRDASATARELVEGVRAASPGAHILLHGEERSAWPALRLAAALGVDTRMGLEDTTQLPDGRVADGNGALIREARRLIAGSRRD